jgi:hypothetical protein
VAGASHSVGLWVISFLIGLLELPCRPHSRSPPLLLLRLRDPLLLPLILGIQCREPLQELIYSLLVCLGDAQ